VASVPPTPAVRAGEMAQAYYRVLEAEQPAFRAELARLFRQLSDAISLRGQGGRQEQLLDAFRTETSPWQGRCLFVILHCSSSIV
jgi:hypothetical protein